MRKTSSKKYRCPISRFICPECGNQIPLPRVKKQREKNHKKDIFCPWCNKITTMLEIREFEAYKTASGDLLAEKETDNIEEEKNVLQTDEYIRVH